DALKMPREAIRCTGSACGGLQACDEVADHRVILLKSAQRVPQFGVLGGDRREELAVLAFVVPRQRGAEAVAEQQQLAAGFLERAARQGSVLRDAQRLTEARVHAPKLGRPGGQAGALAPCVVALSHVRAKGSTSSCR